MHNSKIYKKFNKILLAQNKITFHPISVEKFERFTSAINYCLSSLKEEYRMILKNSYFGNSYEFWWLDYYCKSSYYRKRFWAIVAFVRLFEVIYENFNDSSTRLATNCK